MRRGALAFTLVVLSASPVAAQPEMDERARLHFQAGTSYFDAGDYENALREFSTAHQLSGRAQLLYNVALCHERIGDLDQAITFLFRYLAEQAEIPNRSTIERRLENMRERRERQGGGTSTDSGGAVEPEPVQTAPTQPDPVEPEPAEPSVEPDPAPTPVDEPGGGVPGAAVGAFVAGGVGLAIMGTFGILAAGEHSTLSDDCTEASPCRESDTDTLATYNSIADLGLAVAVIGGTLGVVLLLTSGGDEGGDERAAVSPWVAPDGAGVATAGRF